MTNDSNTHAIPADLNGQLQALLIEVLGSLPDTIDEIGDDFSVSSKRSKHGIGTYDSLAAYFTYLGQKYRMTLTPIERVRR